MLPLAPGGTVHLTAACRSLRPARKEYEAAVAKEVPQGEAQDPAVAEAVRDMVAGLRAYFDQALRHCLLYSHEVQQADEALGGGGGGAGGAAAAEGRAEGAAQGALGGGGAGHAAGHGWSALLMFGEKRGIARWQLHLPPGPSTPQRPARAAPAAAGRRPAACTARSTWSACLSSCRSWCLWPT